MPWCCWVVLDTGGCTYYYSFIFALLSAVVLRAWVGGWTSDNARMAGLVGWTAGWIVNY